MTLVDANTGEVVDDRVRLDDLVPGPRIREADLNVVHVAQLVESVEHLPPVLVRRVADGFEILDGHHRVAALRRSGADSVLAHVVTCTDAEALAFAVEANVAHGLPLSLADKKRNAEALLVADPDLSDREVGRICGLSDKTVGAVRSSAENPQLNDERAGADGKARPTPAKAKAQRAAAEQFIEDHPEATTAEVVEQTGVSAGTASNIRKARTQAEQWADAIEAFPYLACVPERFQAEALAGVAQLDTLDATERPRREANFEKWARSRPDAEAAIEANALREKAERAASDLLDAIAKTHAALSGHLTRHGDLPAGHEALHQVPQAAADLIESLREIPNPERLRSVP